MASKEKHASRLMSEHPRTVAGEVDTFAPDASAVLRWQHRAVLVVATLLLLLPFVSKPLHIDDPLFVWTAQHLRVNPWDFYGFEVNWRGYAAPMHEVATNPPLLSYYLAAVTLVLGDHEVSLHLAALLPTMLAVLGTYELARRFCSRPLLAALVALTSPVFVICSTTLMCDVSAVALWCWSMFFWHDGLVTQKSSRLFLGASLAALAILTKYFGMALIPLLLLDALETRRRLTSNLLWLILPLGFTVGYEYLTRAWYGHGLISDASAYTTAIKQLHGTADGLVTAFRLIVFLGGCVVSIILFAPRLWSRLVLVIGGLIVVTIALVGFVQGWADVTAEPGSWQVATSWSLLAHMMVFLAAGTIVFALIASDVAARRPGFLVLAAWMVGTLVFAGNVNWTLNGRSILPLVPALGILVARRITLVESVGSFRRYWGEMRWRDIASLTMAAAISLLVTAGDHQQASSARTAAELIAQQVEAATSAPVFVGHWGFQYYMQQQGARPLDLKSMSFEPGDQIVVPQFNTSLIAIPPGVAIAADRVEVPLRWPFATMRAAENVGFYSTRQIGHLPWRVGPVSPDEYTIHTVQRPFRFRFEPEAIH